MGVSKKNGGTPIVGWFIREHPNLKWMMTGGIPISGNLHLGSKGLRIWWNMYHLFSKTVWIWNDGKYFYPSNEIMRNHQRCFSDMGFLHSLLMGPGGKAATGTGSGKAGAATSPAVTSQGGPAGLSLKSPSHGPWFFKPWWRVWWMLGNSWDL